MKKWSRWGMCVAVAGTMALCGATGATAAACKEEIFMGATLEEAAVLCPFPVVKDHRDLWEETWDGKARARQTSTVDEWSYDAGEGELTQTLLFVDGRLSRVSTAGYGRPRDPMMKECRNGEALAVGDSMFDAWGKCGEPLERQKLKDTVTESVEGGITRRTSVAVAEWTYRFGPTLPGYTIRFENGTAVDIREREFGK